MLVATTSLVSWPGSNFICVKFYCRYLVIILAVRPREYIRLLCFWVPEGNKRRPAEGFDWFPWSRREELMLFSKKWCFRDWLFVPSLFCWEGL